MLFNKSLLNIIKYQNLYKILCHVILEIYEIEKKL